MSYEMVPRPANVRERAVQSSVRRSDPLKQRTSRRGRAVVRVHQPSRSSVRVKASGRRRRARLTRNELVLEFGFATFAAYRASELWQTIRSRVLEKSGHACVRCGREADQVHHAWFTAANLSGRTLRGLHAACGECLRRSAVRLDGTKTSLAEANAFVLHCSRRKRPASGVDAPNASQPDPSRRDPSWDRPEPDSARQ